MRTVLRDRAAVAFDDALAALGGVHGPAALAPARAVLTDLRGRLGGAVRVAIVGRVSAGKSTLTNALLGGDMVATGVEELTFNINWLRYAEANSLTIHFLDGRPPEHRDPAELVDLTVHREEHRRFLSSIDYLVVEHPNPYLAMFDIVDTPGLDSHVGTDTANTLRFLGRTGEQVRQATVAHASKADALVVVFSRGLAGNEQELLADVNQDSFHSASPITTVGVLAKVELYWRPDNPDPMVDGHHVTEKIMDLAGARRLLYELRPLCSLVGAAAGTCTEVDLADLTELARLDPGLLARQVARAPLFTTRDYPDLPVPVARRRALFDRFGGYGIVLACSLVRQGVDDLATLQAELDQRSGLAGFRRLLVDHFGNRADLITLKGLIEQVRALPRRLGDGLDPYDTRRLVQAVRAFEQLALNEHAFTELDVLRGYYDGLIDFDPPEVAELLAVTGEHGTSVADRLGLPASAGLTEMRTRAQERLAYWSLVTADPALPGRTATAARVVRRSYDRFVHHIGRAVQELEMLQ